MPLLSGIVIVIYSLVNVSVLPSGKEIIRQAFYRQVLEDRELWRFLCVKGRRGDERKHAYMTEKGRNSIGLFGGAVFWLPRI